MNRPAKSLVILSTVALALGPAHCADGPSAGGLAAITPADDVATKMRHFAEQAVLDAKRRDGTVLDYSPASVRLVEGILEKMTRSPEFKRATDKDVCAEALILGAYIGEVIRREHGGTWAKDHAIAGPASFPISSKGHDYFPYGWCLKRLTNGPEDSVWFKYQTLPGKQPER